MTDLLHLILFITTAVGWFLFIMTRRELGRLYYRCIKYIEEGPHTIADWARELPDDWPKGDDI